MPLLFPPQIYRLNCPPFALYVPWTYPLASSCPLASLWPCRAFQPTIWGGRDARVGIFRSIGKLDPLFAISDANFLWGEPNGWSPHRYFLVSGRAIWIVKSWNSRRKLNGFELPIRRSYYAKSSVSLLEVDHETSSHAQLNKLHKCKQAISDYQSRMRFTGSRRRF